MEYLYELSENANKIQRIISDLIPCPSPQWRRGEMKGKR